jgi:NitT/TauT family transport system permease protein
VAFVICFFPIVVNTATGLRSVPEELFDLATSMGGAKWPVFRKIRFPWALPNIFAGLKVGIALAVIGAIVGEFAGSDEGLGYLIRRAAGRADVAYVLASVAVLSMVGIIGFVLIDLLERAAIPWHTSRRHRGAARHEAAVRLDELQTEQHDRVISDD